MAHRVLFTAVRLTFGHQICAAILHYATPFFVLLLALEAVSYRQLAQKAISQAATASTDA
jgi:hypothetical protein